MSEHWITRLTRTHLAGGGACRMGDLGRVTYTVVDGVPSIGSVGGYPEDLLSS